MGATFRSGAEQWRYSVSHNLLFPEKPPVLNVENRLVYKLVLNGSLKNLLSTGLDLSVYGRFVTSQNNLNQKNSPSVTYYFDFSRDFGSNTSLGLKIADPWIVFQRKTWYTYSAGASFRNETILPDFRTFSLYFSKKIGNDKIKSAKKIEVGDSRLNL